MEDCIYGTIYSFCGKFFCGQVSILFSLVNKLITSPECPNELGSTPLILVTIPLQRQETEAQERWGCLLRAARGQGCLLLEESFILLLGWSGSHRAGSRALGNSWVMLIIAFNQPSPYAGNNWGPQLGTQSRPAPRASGVLGGCY